MPYPQVSDFTSDVPRSAWWNVLLGDRRYRVEWDGWSFTEALRRMLDAYLGSPQVLWAQRTTGQTAPGQSGTAWAAQLITRYYLNGYSALTGLSATAFDPGNDWRGVVVTPADIDENAQEFTGGLFRGLYALLNRMETENTANEHRVMVNMPSNWREVIQNNASRGTVDRTVMQILVVLMSNALFIETPGNLGVELPAGAVGLVFDQEPKRPPGAPLPPTYVPLDAATAAVPAPQVSPTQASDVGAAIGRTLGGVAPASAPRSHAGAIFAGGIAALGVGAWLLLRRRA